MKNHKIPSAPIYSIKIPCRIQIDEWKLDVLGLIDTDVLTQFLMKIWYHQNMLKTYY